MTVIQLCTRIAMSTLPVLEFNILSPSTKLVIRRTPSSLCRLLPCHNLIQYRSRVPTSTSVMNHGPSFGLITTSMPGFISRLLDES